MRPCYLGTNFPTREELISHHKSVGEVREAIEATSLAHISLEGLVRAIGIPCSHLCTGCLTGKYPVAIDGEEEDSHGIEMIDPYKNPDL